MKYRDFFMRLVGALVTASACLPAVAQITVSEISGAAQRPDDKSRQALVAIFGNVVNDPLSGSGAPDTTIAHVFQVTNAGILVIGGMLACWVMFRKLTQTAHDGSVFDQRQHVLWGPVRLLWGIVALVPTPNGWSLAQLLMLWGASLMGVGIANLGVDASVSAFYNGNSMVLQPVFPSTVSLAHSLFEANLCMHGINAGLAQASSAGALVTADGYIQQTPTSSGFALKNTSFVCGGADVDNSIDPIPSSTDWFSASISAQSLKDAHLQGLQTMQQSLNTAARDFVNVIVQRQDGTPVSLPDAESAIQSAAQQYEKTISAAAATKQGDIAALASQLGTSISQSGWWILGAWYQTYAQANTKLSDAVAAKASVYGMSSEGDPAMLHLYASSMAAYKAQQATSTYAPPLGTSSTGDYSKGAAGTDANKIIGSLFSAPGQRFVNYLIDINAGGSGMGQMNPLIKMKNIGDYILVVGETALGSYVVAKAIAKVKDGMSLTGLAAKVANAVTSIGDALQGVLDALSPFVIMMVIAFFVIGAMLSVYLPLVPFVVWFGAAINWLVVVGEAVIAAPLWALTHLSGEGDGFGDRTTYGWVFLLNVIVRPILMVAGFFLGGACLIAGGTLLNQLFGIGIANAQFNSTTGIVSVVTMLVIYVSMATNLVHRCFNLIFIVPDQVINWFGAHASSALGHDDNDRLRHSMNVFTNKVEDFANRAQRAGLGRGPRSGNGVQA
ncbi:MAG TPA: DotA/TraY family protein [Burkholderiaceae bacterium]|nr:DotA/TraY family protein [Burkholderiaceae bacterium]